MKYDQYSLTELIRNDDFIAWVLHPEVESEIYWQQFLLKYPEKQKTIDAAREYVILLAKDTGRDMPAPPQSEKMWKMVENSMRDEEKPLSSSEIVIDSKWRWMRVAASAAIILSIGSVSYWFYYRGDSGAHVGATHVTEQKSDLIQRFNDTDKHMMVLLPDGSSVVLEPGAKLSFASNVKNNRREVSLSGKAFFEIAKNKEKPFLVHSSGLVTKVLGTSFLVDATDKNAEVKVEVKTGVVTVFSVKDLSEVLKQKMLDNPENRGVQLIHDQKIAFSKDDGKIVQVAPKPNPAEPELMQETFVFDETPAREVFRQLEQSYNVKIIYNESRFADIPLNATLTGQPFSKKLEVICDALDSHFKIDQGIITIERNE